MLCTKQAKQAGQYFLLSFLSPTGEHVFWLAYTHLGDLICPSSVGWNLSKSSQCRRTSLVLHKPQTNAVCFSTQTEAKLSSRRASESKEQLKSQSMGFGDDRCDDMKKVGQASRQNPGFHLRHKLWGLQSTCGGGTCEGIREIIFGPHFYPIYSISVSICIVYIQIFTFYFDTGSHYVFLVGLGLPIAPEWPWAHRHLPASAPASCYFLWETDISIVLTPHQGNIPLQLSERVTENHNPSKCRGVEPISHGYIYNTTPAPKAQGSLCKRGRKDYKRTEICEQQNVCSF